MKSIKRVFIFLVTVCMVVSQLAYTPMAHDIKLDSEVSVNPISDSSGYITITDTIKTKDLSVAFGSESSVKSASSASLESITLGGIATRKIYRGTDVYITLDKAKFKGSKYLVVITYYDFGPDEGNFFLEYNSSDTSLTSSARAYKRYTVRKTGMTEKWTTVSFLIDDAAFSGAMPHGADMRIVNGAYNAFAKIEIIDYSDCDVTNEGTIIPSELTDSISGRTSYYINYNGKPAIRPYVTAQGWNYEGTKFIFGSYDTLTDGTVDPTSYKIYEYDTVNYTVRCLDTETSSNTGSLGAVVTPDNIIYYSKADGKTWKMNWLTYEKEQTNAGVYGSMNVTNDGQWVSGYGGNSNEVRKSNTVTGVDESFLIDNAKTRWADNEQSMGKGHPMINPEYPHLLFFCHEGTTTYIPDRLWLANYNTDEAYNMFYQVPYDDTITAETSGHEVWSMDGEKMYWVKYTYDKNAGQSGLMRMNKYGNNREYINGDYRFWHCFPSADHNFVIGDTNDRPTKIVLVNANNYESKVISSFNNENSVHPNQPHPHISYNSYAANWQLMKNGVTCIGWNVIRDITAHPVEKQIIPFGNDVNIITCANSVSKTTNYTLNGTTYKKAASGYGIYVDILSKVCASTNADITLEVTYLDIGTSPLDIVYTSGVEDVYDLATREDKRYSITKSNSGGSKVAVVKLENANVNDAGKFMSDLYFTSTDGACISDIKVTANMPGDEMYNNTSIYSRASEDGRQYSGLLVESSENSSYNSNLYHIDDTELWQLDGITQQTVDAAVAAGCSYVTLNTDGAWKYEEHADALKFKRPAYYAPANYRQIGSYNKINGNIYFSVTDNVITENDNEVTFTVNYIDGEGFRVDYASAAANGISSFEVPGTNSGQWRRISVTVNDAKLSSSNSGTGLANGEADIKIASNGNEMYISEISVSKYQQQNNNEGLVTEGTFYSSYEHIASKSQRISVSADNNAADGGLIGTEKANYSTYDSILYHIDDTEGWAAAGLTQENIDAAIALGCSYVTAHVDGAWKYEDFTDADGVTKTAYYSPRNYRPSTNTVISNVYFRLTDNTITEDDKELIFKIEYLDKGGFLTVNYVSDAQNNLSSFTINGLNTGKWETAYVLVNDAALSLTNTQTRLATWEDDIKISGSDGVCVADVTVMKIADGSDPDDMEIIDDKKVEKSSMEPGDVASAVAVVTNNASSAAKVLVLNVVFNADGSIKTIEKSQNVTVASGKTVELETPQVTLGVGETQRTFVWGGNLAPIMPENDPLDLSILKYDNGTVKLRWSNYSWPGYFFNIYCDGELVGRTTGSTYLLENVKPGSYVYTVDVADNLGRVIFRSRAVNIDI